MRNFTHHLTAIALALCASGSAWAETILPTTADISDCKGYRYEEFDTDDNGYESEEQTIWGSVKYADGMLTITWLDFIMECCPIFKVALQKEEPNILLFDITGSLGECDCMCSYDLTGTFEGITPGHYVLKLGWPEYAFLTQEIDIEEGCDITLSKAPAGIQTVSVDSDIVSISSDGLLHISSSEDAFIEIFDASGGIRTRINAHGGDDIDVSSLSKGIYVVKASSGDKTDTLRFIK